MAWILSVTLWTSLSLALANAQERLACETCKGDGKVTCADCNGAYRTVEREVPCKRVNGVGCDGRGYRTCVTCAGAAGKACNRCSGSGRMSEQSGMTGNGGFRKPRFVTRNCNVCLGSGRIDCNTCWPLWVKESKDKAQPPTFSHDPPAEAWVIRRGRNVRWDEMGSDFGTWQRFQGMIICPRCNGRCVRVEKSRCEKCEKGRVDCPDCET